MLFAVQNPRNPRRVIAHSKRLASFSSIRQYEGSCHHAMISCGSYVLSIRSGFFFAAGLLSLSVSHAGESSAFFEKKIRPVLIKHCYECHSSDAELLKAEFLLDTRSGIRKGGVSGRDAVIPGDVAGSHLIEAIRYGNEDFQMPPDGKLPESVIGDFETWIAMGAPDPRDGISLKPSEKAAKEHWAYQPVTKPQIPAVKNKKWARNDIDRFILARLEFENLKPVADAGPLTLLRRIYFDLTGLPPTPEQVESFDIGKIQSLVDELLASPQFGVKWGRHWLDVARYAESSGYSRNMLYPDAWRYRNYVIDSLNSDKPYNQFIREQIAGDLLPAATSQQRDEQSIATGFLNVGPKTLGEGNVLLFRLNTADDLIDATCRAFLSLTVNCSRCHDHKYDPIPTRDYYALAGIFLSTEHRGGVETNNRHEHAGLHALGPDGQKSLQAVADHKKKADQAQKTYMEFVKKRNDIRTELEKKKVDWKKNPGAELVAAEKIVQEHQAIVRAAKANPPPFPDTAMVVLDAALLSSKKEIEKETATESSTDTKKKPVKKVEKVFIADSPIYEKGLHDAPKEAVPRGALSLFAYATKPIPDNQSGRLQLADWLADSRNPLTSRVIVNRIWKHLFGRGLVETVDNFGVLGAKPSHPELLDHLAIRFTEEGWSIKKLIKDIVMSRCYQLSAVIDPHNQGIDEGNVLLWRHTPRLLDAEALRDSLLFVSGKLDPKPLIGSQVSDVAATMPNVQGREVGRRDYFVKDAKYDVPIRSVYLPIVRSAMPDALTLFDVADPNIVVGQRKNTAVPMQALFLMNSPFVAEQVEHLVDRVLGKRTVPERIDRLYLLTLNRLPTTAETRLMKNFLADAADKKNWQMLCQTLIQSGEFRIIY